MRFPYVINVNTKICYDPSNEARVLLGEVDRRVFSENLEWGDEECPTLVTWCIRTISKNFEDRPIINDLYGSDRDQLLEILSTDLPIELIIPLIDDDYYWKRRYVAKYGVISQKPVPDWTWKSTFIERYMRERLENAQPQYCDENEMEEITTLASPYVRHLIITELQAWKPPLTMEKDDIPEVYPIEHINFTPILKNLLEVTELDIIYGQNRVGDDFNWNMFKVSVLDFKRLGEAVLFLDNITILRIHRSNIGDGHVQALMQSLIKNRSLIELNLSNCTIEDHGALCIAKLMTVHPTLEILKLSNNRIKTVGTEGIGFALLEESCCPLIHLDLRLNPLRHEGIMGIFRALVRGDKPKELNLAGCLFEDITSVRLAQVLKLNSTLEVLDVSSNWIGEDGAVEILTGLEGNKSLKWLDLRETDIPIQHLRAIKKLVEKNRIDEELLEEEVEEEEEEVKNESLVPDEAAVSRTDAASA